MISTFAVFHYNDKLIFNPEELLVADKERHLILANFIIEAFKNCNLVKNGGTYP